MFQTYANPRLFFAAITWSLLCTFLYLGCSTSTLTTNPTPVKCQVSVPGGTQAIGANGGSTMVSISAQPECTWSATSDASWIAELKPNSGQGNGQVEIVVAANPTASNRQGSVKVNDSVVPITQEGTACQFSVTGPADVSASGGSLTFNVTALSGCAWTASSSASWLTLAANSGGSGSGNVSVNVAANTGSARSGSITIAGRVITIAQTAGSDCLSVSSLPAPIAAAGGPAVVTVSANGSCSWTASSPVPWITVSPESGVGGATVTLTVASNSGSARSAAVSIAGQNITVTQSSLICSYSINPSGYTAASGGGSSTLAVTTSSACGWTATADVDWVGIALGATGSGNGSVSFSVSANPGGTRTGTIRAGDQTFTITQAAAPAPTPPPACSYTLGGTSQTVTSSAGSGAAITVTTNSSCTWTATSGASWLSITSGASTTGSGAVAFTVTANTGALRSTTLTIAGQSYVVTQSAAAPPPPTCTFSINPTSQSIASTGGAGSSINVAAGPTCTWTAASNDSWLTISSGATGTGPGPVTFSAAANSGGARNGTLTIAGQTFTVNQAAAPPPCSFSVSPTSASLPVGGGAGPGILVTTTPTCGWTAASNDTWLTITSSASVTGSGTVSFSASANTGAARSGSLLIAGQTITVSQAPLCTYSIAPTSISVDDKVHAGNTVAVTATAGCGWTAVSNVAWVTITSPSSGGGTGSGSVVYTIVANPGGRRTGTMTIATKTFTVDQDKH